MRWKTGTQQIAEIEQVNNFSRKIKFSVEIDCDAHNSKSVYCGTRLTVDSVHRLTINELARNNNEANCDIVSFCVAAIVRRSALTHGRVRTHRYYTHTHTERFTGLALDARVSLRDEHTRTHSRLSWQCAMRSGSRRSLTHSLTGGRLTRARASTIACMLTSEPERFSLCVCVLV